MPPEKRLNIPDSTLTWLQETMAKLPREYVYPEFDTTAYYDSYGNFFSSATRKHASLTISASTTRWVGPMDS